MWVNKIFKLHMKLFVYSQNTRRLMLNIFFYDHVYFETYTFDFFFFPIVW